jgi:alcohol dehydrogenase
MRAVQYDQFGQQPYVTERPDPKPRPHGAVIRVEATGLCRSDWHGWQGHDSDIQTLPHVPGHEFAGTVVEVGSAVSRIQVGNRVTVPFVCGCGNCRECDSGNAQVCPYQWQPGFNGPGSFAEYVAVPQADFNVVVLPDEITSHVAAGLGCRFATAYGALTKAITITPGDSVAIFGCGGVGLSAIMIAKSLGARVAAIDKSNAALDRARLAGADLRLDAQYDEVLREVRQFGGEGVDFTVDALGSVDTARLSVESLRRRGRHVQVGLLPPAEVNDRATIPMHLVIGRELEIVGSHGLAAVNYPQMLSAITSGALRPETLIERVISLDEAPEALMTMANTQHPGVTIIAP